VNLPFAGVAGHWTGRRDDRCADETSGRQSRKLTGCL